jgi:hypothetical protein
MISSNLAGMHNTAGSCWHCAAQVRCKTGAPFNNGRQMRISDLIYYRPYQIKDNFGRDWPGESMLIGGRIAVLLAQ